MMDEAAWGCQQGKQGQAGSAHLRSITLRRHMVLSPPQWATAAKQAKCRQTFFGSAWVTPHQASLELANLGRVGRGWGGWLAGMGTGNFPFLKTPPLSWLLSCGDWKSRTFFPGFSGSRHHQQGGEFESLLWVSESHSQIPESQEQVGLSTLMLQNTPEGRSPEWVFSQEGNWILLRSPAVLTTGCLSRLMQCLV